MCLTGESLVPDFVDLGVLCLVGSFIAFMNVTLKCGLKSSTCFISCSVFSPDININILVKKHTVSKWLSTSVIQKRHFFTLKYPFVLDQSLAIPQDGNCIA